MLHRTEGVVLRTRDYGEADLIVSFLTRDFGIIHTFARSPRKTKSRFGSSLEPLSYVKLSFWGKENARLPRLTQSDIIKSFQKLRESVDCFLRVSELLKVILICSPERDVSYNMFVFLLRALSEFESGCLNPLIMLSIKIKLLKITGFAPRLAGCARCGASGMNFHFSDGAVLCNKCGHTLGRTQSLSPGCIRLYDCLSRWTIEKIYRVKTDDGLIGELTSVIDSHVKYYISGESRQAGGQAG
ncbi:DNA repair protein RecO [bacterium BMS3Bbin05]|nr:DNA repair protein RecO [bacterium BMS3Bbin05]HDL20150.1 DNA repair protein RecO [Nitrospirota bacterium]HDO21555.1 DNA repair protein RecO [Nitrospirota bacterium]HDZ87391.1 DNA repair protein RecO [Nitrospirota bacterium]